MHEDSNKKLLIPVNGEEIELKALGWWISVKSDALNVVEVLKVESDALNVVEVLNRACELTEGKVADASIASQSSQAHSACNNNTSVKKFAILILPFLHKKTSYNISALFC
jgi:hypothetical protein